MHVFKGIKELWAWPFDGRDVLSVFEEVSKGRRPQYSVMALDCGTLRWDVEDIVRKLIDKRWSYEDLMYNMAPAKSVGSALPQEWSDLERYREGASALTHYTDMEKQPWIRYYYLLFPRLK